MGINYSCVSKLGSTRTNVFHFPVVSGETDGRWEGSTQDDEESKIDRIFPMLLGFSGGRVPEEDAHLQYRDYGCGVVLSSALRPFVLPPSVEVTSTYSRKHEV